MKEDKQFLLSFYPDNYRYMTEDERAIFKERLYERYPEIPLMWSDYMTKLSGLKRDAKNYPIQGTSASMTKYAAILIRRELKKRKLNAYLTNIIHDENNGEATIEDAEEFATIMEECMVKAAKRFCKKVNFAAVASVVDYWSH